MSTRIVGGVRRGRRTGLSLLAAGLLLGAPAGVGAELSLGLTGGAALAREQDVLIEERGSGGAPGGAVETRGAGPSAGPLVGATLALWGAHVGVQLDGLYWSNAVRVDQPGSSARLRLEQERWAVLVSLLARLHVRERGGPYAYLGASGGVVVAAIDPGPVVVGGAVGALGGLAFPLTPRLRLRLEVRYLLTPDVDGDDGARRVEISGSSGDNPGRAVFGPHRDVQFVPIAVGLDWVF